MPDTDPVVGVYDLLREALELRGMNNDKVRSLRGPLRRAGFTNIQLIKKKIPLGFWPRDPQKRLLGCYLRAAVLDVLLASWSGPFPSWACPSWSRRSGWPSSSVASTIPPSTGTSTFTFGMPRSLRLELEDIHG